MNETLNVKWWHRSFHRKSLWSVVLCWAGYMSTASAACTLTKEFVFDHAEIGAVQIFRDTNANAIAFTSQMQVNTDGAPDSYHPNNIGITHICNGVSVGPHCTWKANCLAEFNQAKAEGFRGPTRICFFAMASDPNGLPVIQDNGDPQPGYFVSTTALKQPGEKVRTPRAQLDSNTVPFAVIPGHWQATRRPGPRLGDFGFAYRRSTDKLAFFVIGDIGPKKKLGEGSVALHQAMGNDPFVMRHGVRRALRGIGSRDVFYVVFPNTAQPGPRLDATSIENAARPLLNRFGGLERLQECARSPTS